jgi:hypothetical protein
MIKAGVTTRKEALSLLGDPDFTRKVSAATEEWQYQEEDKTIWQRTPVVGGAFSSSGHKRVILTLEGDIVTAARFGSFDKHEFDWQDDYSWQKKHQTPEQKTDNK